MPKTLVTFLLDRTGSMEPIRDDTIGAFNAYLETLQEGDSSDVFFSLLTFDSMSVDKVHVNQPVKDIPRLTRETFVPRASTPLIDASVKAIHAVEKSVGDGDTKVVICIQTDGQENASTEHTWGELNALIKAKTAAGWQFNFMGAGIDAYEQGKRMGIAAMNTMSYDAHDAQATTMAFAASAQNTRSFASGATLSTAYTSTQRLQSGDRFAPGDLAAPAATVVPSSGWKSHPPLKPGSIQGAPKVKRVATEKTKIVDDITL